jgi:hypothetical protein
MDPSFAAARSRVLPDEDLSPLFRGTLL